MMNFTYELFAVASLSKDETTPLVEEYAKFPMEFTINGEAEEIKEKEPVKNELFPNE